jgi:predicted aldo/keto reductase-like oxidoreductase
MKYRRFGKLDWQVSALGFGAMRLPIIGNDASKIDEPEAAKMIRYAIDRGLNYVDTAYVYHRGSSEAFLGKVLKNGYRKRIKLTSKMPTWIVNSQQDMDKCLKEQLAKLQTDHLDFYLLHGLTKDRWPKLKELNVLKWAEKKMEEGKFLHLGFSFHDDLVTFKDIINSYDGWTLSQIQYNYMDSDYQAGTEGLKFAASKGLSVVVMEPIAGGRLAIKPPKLVQDIWAEADVKRTPAEWALMWVWNQPEVSVVLSGMSTMDQVVENLNSADRSDTDVLTKKEIKLIARVAAKYEELGFVACTGCRYCQPCPQGVNIPEIMSFYNEFYIKDRDDAIKTKYWEHITPETQAKRCERCGACEKLCPQQLPIKEILSRAAMIFELERPS